MKSSVRSLTQMARRVERNASGCAASIPQTSCTTDKNPTGEAVSLDARTHPTRTSRLLHTEATCHRGEFPVDDHYGAYPSSTTAAIGCGSATTRPLYVDTTCVHFCDAKQPIADASEHDALLGDLDGLGGHMPMTGQPPAAANAAVALTQLHQWDSDFVSISGNSGPQQASL